MTITGVATWRDVLLDLCKRDGVLTPEAIVEAAKDPASPLHREFEWNNSAAATAWRLHQARQLIIRVHVEDVPMSSPPRAYVALRTVGEAGGGYVPTAKAAVDYHAELLARFKADATAFRLRWKHMAEYAEVVRELLD